MDTPRHSPENPIPNLQDQLDAQLETASGNFASTVTNRLDLYLLTHETGISTEHGLKKMFQEKASEITESVKRLHEEDKAKGMDRQESWYARKSEAMLKSLQSRFDLALLMAGGENKKISTFDELNEFLNKDSKLLKSIDVFTLWEEQGLTPEKIGEKAPEDLMALAKKLDEDAELTNEDWQLLEKETKKLIHASGANPSEAHRDVKRFFGFTLMDKLDTPKRKELLTRILDTKGMSEVIVNLTLTNYLTVADGLELLKQGIRDYPDREVEFSDAFMRVDTPEMKAAKAQFANLQKEAVHVLESKGRTLTAGKLLSLPGIFGWFVLKNFGIWTIIGNLIAAKGNPFELATNPAFWGGVGVAAASAEWFTSKGQMGRGELTGSIAKLLGGNKSEIEVEEQNELREKVKEMIGSEAHFNEFYLGHAEEIIRVISKNSREGKSLTDFTLADVGIDYNALDPKFQTIPQDELQTLTTHVGAFLYSSESGLALKSLQKQKDFLKEEPKPKK